MDRNIIVILGLIILTIEIIACRWLKYVDLRAEERGYILRYLEELQERAVECLRLKVEQPYSLEIEAVSPVMEIIGGHELTQGERASIATSLAEYVAPWKERSNAIDLKSPRIISLIESEMQINLMSSTSMKDSSTRNRVTGYKVAVDYSCVSAACGRYRSRHWFFFDPDKRIIYKSLEVPQL